MTCQKVGDLFSAYIDGELIGRQCAAVESHLVGCASCREELETLRSAVAMLEAPKAMARPEGLLEEFKAKYLPEAEAVAAAPRWGLKLPALPKVEWPSMGRVLLPMGGIAAAAAALLVSLNNTPPTTVAVNDRPLQVAQIEVRSTDAGSEKKLVKPAAPEGSRTPSAPKTTRLVLVDRTEAGDNPSTTRVTRPQMTETSAPATPSRRRSVVVAEVPRSEPRVLRGSPGPRLKANERYAAGTLASAVLTDDEIKSLADHAEATPSPEDQWKDVVVVINRTSPATNVEEGFAEVSCRNLKTGEVKSATIGTPTVAATGEPAPAASAPVTTDGEAPVDRNTDNQAPAEAQGH